MSDGARWRGPSRSTRGRSWPACRPPPRSRRCSRRLAVRYRLAILSNWPLAATIDRYVEAAGWTPYLAAVVVSQRVGTIKPHPAIFAAARAALDDPPPAAILHVGDDWAADIVGAKRAGWRAAYLASRPGDSPLPGSERDRRGDGGPGADHARGPGARPRAARAGRSRPVIDRCDPVRTPRGASPGVAALGRLGRHGDARPTSRTWRCSLAAVVAWVAGRGPRDDEGSRTRTRRPATWARSSSGSPWRSRPCPCCG